MSAVTITPKPSRLVSSGVWWGRLNDTVQPSAIRDSIDSWARVRELPRLETETPLTSNGERAENSGMGPARLERATSCSGGKRSIQLSYGPVSNDSGFPEADQYRPTMPIGPSGPEF